ncbi:MAG: hypothetical protein RLY20_1137 [Verrucomicrobiota bacterium]|jgi:competence ComEA-like helix-hairpin-helix protein
MRLNFNRRTCGSVLVGVLWCVVLLAVMVISVLHTARMDLLTAKNYGDRIQARYLALAGVEKAKALLYQEAHLRSRSGKNHTGELYDAPDLFREVPLGRGVFSVLRGARQDEGGGVAYGVSDEESRLHLNMADVQMLAKLEGMTPQLAAAIVDWRDDDNSPSPGGAEAEFYLSLKPPRQPRNAPFLTVRELLMVRGVTPELVFGRDVQQNGFLESAEDAPDQSARSQARAADIDTGWAGMLTVDSMTDNVNASGVDRVNVKKAEEPEIVQVPGISADIARAITSFRSRGQLESIASLLDVTPPQNNQTGRNGPGARGGQRQRGPDQVETPGQKIISPELLMNIADDITTDEGATKPGLININTASLSVLMCLPGVDRELAQAIISYRRSTGYFQNIAWLLKVPGVSEDMFKQVAPLITARSETFRIISEGRVNSTGARQRIQAIVHIGRSRVMTLSYREDNL